MKNILQLLSAMKSSDSAVHAQIHEQVLRFQQIPEFNRYLVWILTNPRGIEEFERESAGILLKNNLERYHKHIPPADQQYVKNSIVKAVGDPSYRIRNTCSIIITTLIGVGSIRGWSGIINFLAKCLEDQDPNVVEGAFLCLDRICEDHAPEMDTDDAGKPLDFLLPSFLQFFRSPNNMHRLLAVSCIEKVIFIRPPSLITNLDKFLEGIFYLANDPDKKVKRKVCNTCIRLVEFCGNNIDIPKFPKIIEYILYCVRDNDMDLALDATDFWRVITHNDHICEAVLKPFLPNIFSVLLTRMMYTKEDLIDLGGYDDGAEDSHIPDRDQDVKPSFTSSVNRTGSKTEDDGGEGYDDVTHWNIRKGSAEGLDFIAQVFHGKVIETLLPLVEKGLQSSDWLTRESSILALGCIARGSFEEMRPFLAGLVPYLFELLNDKYPLIRSITCWTLSRYSHWILKQAEKDKYFSKLIGEFLKHMKDKNKRVQKAATAALAATIEVSREHIIPYTSAIVQSINSAFGYFQRINTVALYDCISTLAWAIGPRLNNEEYLRNILPPLFSLWERINDDDADLFPLFECFAQISLALGPAFFPYAKTIYSRCLRIIENVLVVQMRANSDPRVPQPNREFLICAADLISSLFQSLKSGMEPLVTGSNIVPLMVEVCKDQGEDIAGCSFAIIGELARYCPEQVRGLAPNLVEYMLSRMDPRNEYLCNNAMWSVGELFFTLKSQPLIEKFAEPVLNRLFLIFMDRNADRLIECCAVAMGRVSFLSPKFLSPQIKSLIRPWSISLRNLHDDYEKECGLAGLCEVIKQNPYPVIPELPSLCEVIASVHHITVPAHVQLFGTVLHSFKSQVEPVNWDRMFRTMSNSTQDYLRKTYGL